MNVVTFQKPTRNIAGFECNDEVIVSSNESPFYTWRGHVSAVLLCSGATKYQVRFVVANNTILLPALLFKFEELELAK